MIEKSHLIHCDLLFDWTTNRDVFSLNIVCVLMRVFSAFLHKGWLFLCPAGVLQSVGCSGKLHRESDYSKLLNKLFDDI